jgi:Xaa-Pro aminopeptidase
MSIYDIDVQACRTRQQRLVKEMHRKKLDLVVLTQIEHIQYFTGPRFTWFFSPVAAIDAQGHVTLIAPARKMPEVHAADDVRPFDAQWLSTLRNDQRVASSDVLFDALKDQPKPGRLGVEFANCSPYITQALGGEAVDIDPTLYEMRRRKDLDELARIKKAIAATGAMYEQARAMIAPGVNELDVFNELQAAAVRVCGEMLTGTGNDYASGARGGAPRDRMIEDGEIYILDLGPAFRGYFADNCRGIAVNGKPTDEQLKLWQHIMPVHEHVKATVKPGKSCRELFEEAKLMLADGQLELPHHLGHGIGLFPHEAPHLNPNWNDTFQEGEVFACEPGLYAERYRFGLRLENNYLVTADGVELLSDFPMEL